MGLHTASLSQTQKLFSSQNIGFMDLGLNLNRSH